MALEKQDRFEFFQMPVSQNPNFADGFFFLLTNPFSQTSSGYAFDKQYPVVVSELIENVKEIELNTVSMEGEVVAYFKVK